MLGHVVSASKKCGFVGEEISLIDLHAMWHLEKEEPVKMSEGVLLGFRCVLNCERSHFCSKIRGENLEKLSEMPGTTCLRGS